MKSTDSILTALRRLDAEHRESAALFGPILCSLPGATALAASWRAIAEHVIPTTFVMTIRPTIDDLSRPSDN